MRRAAPWRGGKTECRPYSSGSGGALRAAQGRCTAKRKAAKIAAFSTVHRARRRHAQVDNIGARRLYKASWARRRWARWRVCEAPHCSHGDRALGHEAVAMFASPRRMCGVRRLRTVGSDAPRRNRKVPGCLTGESEERETWTAESLRAAFANGRPFVARPWKRLRRSYVSGQHCGSQEPEWDLVKRCDQPGKDLIQLESLILAQSERWRQA